MSPVIDEIRALASEMYHAWRCNVLRKIQIPAHRNGATKWAYALKDMEECSYVKETWFIWLKQNKKCEEKFEKVGKPLQYAAKVTTYMEPNRIKKLADVKAKELPMWLTLTEIKVDNSPTEKIRFKDPKGLSRMFPVDAFQIEEEKPAAKEDKVTVPPAAVEVKEI